MGKWDLFSFGPPTSMLGGNRHEEVSEEDSRLIATVFDVHGDVALGPV